MAVKQELQTQKSPPVEGRANTERMEPQSRCLESRRGAGDCKGDTRSPALGRALLNRVHVDCAQILLINIIMRYKPIPVLAS